MSVKNGIILAACITFFVVSSSAIGGVILQNKIKNSTVVYKATEEKIDKADITDTSKTNTIKKEETSNDNIDKANSNDVNDSNSKKEETTTNSNIDNNANISTEEDTKKEVSDGSIDLNVLGEIMLGGQVTKNLNYNYLDAFKEVYTVAKDADFTYANLSTNITSLDKIDYEDTKSKYLVTKDAISALNSLGLDSVSIASDHIADYPKDIVNNTVESLEKNEIFVAGRENLPVYLQKDDKKIAIISTNAIINGTTKNYTDLGVSVYTKENLEKNIKEAKQTAQIIIVDVHFGKEHSYGLNDQMRDIAKSAIDLGADMVIGSHALGVYPIVKYKDKPIIYSSGFLISDSDYNLAKEGYIFNIKISKDSKIDTITMTPIYNKDKKSVSLYKDYDLIKSKAYLELFNTWHLENSLDSKVEDNKIVVKF